MLTKMFTAVVLTGAFWVAGDAAASKFGCCFPGSECCDPPRECCVTPTTAPADDCCAQGADCCNPARECCVE